MHKYGLEWDDIFDDLNIELVCFRDGHTREAGGLGKAGHFRRAAEILWGPENRRKQFVWHPWAEEMLAAACAYKYLGVTGAGGIGKSEFFAIWMLINWMCAPLDTLGIVTSTTLTAAKGRIWGIITEYFTAVPNLPGKLVDSMGIIQTFVPEHGVKASSMSGIVLVAGDPAREKESMDKLIGRHNKRVFLIGDELPALSHALVRFATTNLSSNPFFQFIGMGNARSKFDPHGRLCTPKDGWNSVNEDTHAWETELGYALHFDAEKSPNVLAGKVIYPWLPKEEDIALSKHRNGPDSLDHWSQCRGFWCPEGTDPECIYSETDITDGDATEKDVQWIGSPAPVSFCDPAWSHGGDACIATFGLFGMSANGQQMLLVTETVKINDKKSDPTPRVFQVARQYRDLCVARKVLPQNAGCDVTGGGALFIDVLSEEWDGSVYALNFAGATTDTPTGSQMKPASDLFADRVSEIWMVGKDFLRSGQLRGLTAEIINDLTARKEVGQKQGLKLGKRAVEPKRVMKKRIKRSPDQGDSFFGMLDLCRVRLKFRANTALVHRSHSRAQWVRTAAKAQAAEATALPDNMDDFTRREDTDFETEIGMVRAGKGWEMEVQEENDFGFG